MEREAPPTECELLLLPMEPIERELLPEGVIERELLLPRSI
jgi:hypothetical protein